MKGKVLIVSSPFFDYQLSVAHAFEELGYEVEVETYDEPIHPFKGLLKWRHKFSHNKEALRQKSRIKYNAYICERFQAFSPDLVFIYNGNILFDETLDFFRKSSKVLLWMYDSVLRKDRTMCLTHIDHVDAFFCFERKDVDYYQSIGKTAYFLPLACDTHVYFPIEKNEKDIDILFVGTIYLSPKRIRLLRAVVNRFPDKKILIYGHYKPYYKNPIKWLFREKRSIFKNINISPEKVNELFSRSRIALNIHNEQTLDGANQRVFEACGAGAYQICDSNPYIKSLFPHGEVGLYNNEEELMALIENGLTTDKKNQAQKACQIILSNHTFEKRVEQMLDILYNHA